MEIERKFLLEKIPFCLDELEKFEIKQGYISTNPTIRLRKINENFVLTVKGSGQICREEFELSLTKFQFETLWEKVETTPIEKTRFKKPLESGTSSAAGLSLESDRVAEIDVFKGTLSGLLTVEVEFDTLEEANKFTPPSWFSKEVSTDPRYKNSNLSKNPTVPEKVI